MINLEYREENGKETVKVDMEGLDIDLLMEIGAGVTSVAEIVAKDTEEDFNKTVCNLFRYFCGVMRDAGHDITASSIGTMMVLRENPVTEEDMAESREVNGDD